MGSCLKLMLLLGDPLNLNLGNSISTRVMEYNVVSISRQNIQRPTIALRLAKRLSASHIIWPFRLNPRGGMYFLGGNHFGISQVQGGLLAAQKQSDF